MTRPGRRRGGHGSSRVDRLLESTALGLASGLLLGLPFLRPELWWLHWVALAPWAVLLADAERAKTPLFVLAGGFAAYAMAMGPYSALSNLVPFWTSALVYTPWLVVFALALRAAALRWRVPLVLAVPVAWVATEWLRLSFSIGAVGLFPLASSQVRLSGLLQVAELTGAAGVSFVVAAASGALADLWRRGWKIRGAWRPIAAFGLLLAAVLGYGWHRLDGLSNLREGPRIAVIQPNEIHYRDPSKARALLERQLALVRETVEPGTADLIALPENTVDFPFEEDPYFGRELARLARSRKAAVLAGAFRWADRTEQKLHTSAYYFSETGDLLGIYDKLYLIPWAEYLPFQGWLPRLSRRLGELHASLSERVVGWLAKGVPGEEIELFRLESAGRSLRFATPICFEITNARFARRAAVLGAEALVNISSEGFFGAPVYHHMWALSTLRAVENRLAVVRVGNNGISGFIDAGGRPQRVVRGRETGRPYLEPGTVVDRPRIADAPGTFYSRAGDWLSTLCLAVTAGLLLSAPWAPPRLRTEPR